MSSPLIVRLALRYQASQDIEVTPEVENTVQQSFRRFRRIPDRMESKINAALGSLNKNPADFPWIYSSSRPFGAGQSQGDQFEIHLKHRTLLSGAWNAEAAIEALLTQLLDAGNRHALSAIYDGEYVVFSPVTMGTLSDTDRLFGTIFCMKMLEYSERSALHKELGDRKSTFSSNKSKWFHGPLHTMVFVTDILCFVSSKPPEADDFETTAKAVAGIATWWATGKMEGAECVEFAKCCWVVLKAARYQAPKVNKVVKDELNKMDFKQLKQELQTSKNSFFSATVEAEHTLRLAGETELTIACLDETIASFALVINKTPDMFTASEKMKDRAIGPVVTSTVVTVTSYAVAVGVSICPPAGAITAVSLYCGGLAGSFVGAHILGKNLAYLRDCNRLSKEIASIGSHCHQIWLFLQISLVRLSGMLSDESTQTRAFATKMKSVFDIDIADWRKPEYMKQWLDIQHGVLQNRNKAARRSCMKVLC